MTFHTVAKHEKLNFLHCYECLKFEAKQDSPLIKVTLNGESLSLTKPEFESLLESLVTYWHNNRPFVNEDDYNERIDGYYAYWNNPYKQTPLVLSERGEVGVLPLAVILWSIILITLALMINHIFGGTYLTTILNFLRGVI